ncbi:MAG TPA: alpha/beta hydrolase domain-containing protein [Myxococcales bacterium]
MTLKHSGPALAGLVFALAAAPSHARITRIVIDRTTPLAGQTVPYETLAGRAFGELDPADPHDAIITDINLAKDPDGKVRYVTSFLLVKPVDLANASGFLWHDVPNRGGRITIVAAERNLGDIGLSSGWQPDNAGATSVPANATALTPQPGLASNDWVLAPVARNADGSSITGIIQARIINRSGPSSAPLNVQNNPVPFLPATLDTTQAVLRTRFHETIDGHVTEGSVIPSSDWAFAHCDATHPFPGIPQDLNHADLPASLPVHVCLKNGFDGGLLYELTYPVKDPYVEGVGFAAFRDLNQFFKTAAQDDFGTANPVASTVKWTAIRGVSQSGNFTRAFIQLGFNQDEAGRIVHEGAWPIIAGRRVSLDSRWAQPDGVLELYQMGSEGPQWWGDWPDEVRNNPSVGILDRCTASGTCPKVIEHFGGAEVFALKMTTEWVGTAADADIPLPDNVRRYYVSSSTHGGGNGAMTQNSATTGPGCPGNNWGSGAYRANPMPETQLQNVLRLALRAWVMNGTPPPASIWPTLASGVLVDPTMKAMHHPHGIPSIPETIFSAANFVNPVFDYDFGPFFDRVDAVGVPTDEPPAIRTTIQMKVPRVDGDGNEFGGVPTVLRDAPLGTYLGWNLTPTGFHEGQVCDYVGGFIPFAITQAQRTGPDTNVRFHISANGKGGKFSKSTAVAKDPRPSLQERYGTHAGYVTAVTAAANNAQAQGYLLPEDAAALIAQAQASDVLVTTTGSNVPAFGEIDIGTSGEGGGVDELTVNPGDTLDVGYTLSLPGKHPATTITLTRPEVVVQLSCDSSGKGRGSRNSGPLLVDLPAATIAVAANSSAWLPSADPNSAATFQGSVQVPDLCSGGRIRIGSDATFTATVGSQ